MVELLPNFLESERDSNWKCHIECFKAMLPFDRIFYHSKYFQWGLVYLVDMLRLPHYAPDVYQQFLDGKHTVSRSKKASRFNAVSTDMALEQSLNRESKVKGGIIGVTHDSDSVEKWTITSHLRSAVVENLKEMAGITQDNSTHKELLVSSIDKSEKQVTAVIDAIQAVSNPFDFMEWMSTKQTRSLINIVNGSVMPLVSAERLLNAAKEGGGLLIAFIEERMIQNSEKFWDPIKKLKVSTFASTNKPVKIQSGKERIQVFKVVVTSFVAAQ